MNDVAVVPQANPFGSLAPRAGGGGAMAQAAQQRQVAEVQAMMLMARMNPRDQRLAMDRILNAFTRRSLAESAQYQFSRGGSDVSGPSIRALEAIAQQWGSINSGWREVDRGVGADGVPYSEIQAFAIDIETLARKEIDFRVRHWRDTKKGGYKLTDDRDVYELCANQASRRVRNCLMAVIPGDVTEAAMLQADSTLAANADTGPDAMKKMLDLFAEFGVTKEQIETRIQRRLDAIQPAQVVSLRKVYASLRDGMSKPAEWFDMGDEASAAAGATGAAIDGLNAEIAGKPAKAAAQPATGQQSSGAQNAQQRPATQAAAASGDLPYPAEALLKRLQSSADVDVLDADASLIAKYPLPVQKDLTAAYKARRAELTKD